MPIAPRKKKSSASAKTDAKAKRTSRAAVLAPVKHQRAVKKSNRPRVSAAVIKRFEGYIQKERKCWTWLGSHTEDGYGQFWVNHAKVVKAHRFAFEIYIRQLSARERLRNTCENKRCVNPACWQPFTIGERKRLALGTQRK